MGKFREFIIEQHDKIDNLFESFVPLTDLTILDGKTKKLAQNILNKLTDMDAELVGDGKNVLVYDKKINKLKVKRRFSKYESEIKTLFNVELGNGSSQKRTMPEGVTPTIFFETFAALGFLKNTKNINELLKVSHDEIFPIHDASMFDDATQAEGLNIATTSMKYAKTIGSVTDIIRGDIVTFYDKLAAFEDINPIKPNTADIVVLVKGKQSDLYSALDNKEVVSFDKAGKITVGSTEFYQLSLKASEHARLGRITTLLNIKYKNDLSYNDMFVMDESFKNIISFIGSMTQKTYEQIKSGVVTLLNRLKSIFNVSKLEKEGNLMFKKDKDLQYIYTLSQKLREDFDRNDKSQIKTIITNMNKSFNKLKDYNSKDIVVKVNITKLSEPETKEQLNLLLANKISSNYLNQLLSEVKKSKGSTYIKDIVTLMRKGGTDLPVVMLYGSGKSKVLIDIPEVEDASLPSIIVNVGVGIKSNSYYVVTLYFLSEIKKDIDDSLYIEIQFTNAGGAKFSFKVEGKSLETYKSIKV